MILLNVDGVCLVDLQYIPVRLFFVFFDGRFITIVGERCVEPVFCLNIVAKQGGDCLVPSKEPLFFSNLKTVGRCLCSCMQSQTFFFGW